MNRILLILLAATALTATAKAQGSITMVSTYQCSVPASAAEADELDSVATEYVTNGADTSITSSYRYERATQKLLEKQVAFSHSYLKKIGYTGAQRPYFYQYRYDGEGRIIYSGDLLSGRYQLVDYTENSTVIKTFDTASRTLVDQQVRPAGTLVAVK